MKKQMKAMGLAIDWSREMRLRSAQYYKWNQWLFLKMLEKGVAYRKTQIVNWDPVDQTVLANEGSSTAAAGVPARPLARDQGYYLRITDYADELLGAVQNDLPGWPERVRLMQENWIGKSEGPALRLPAQDRRRRRPADPGRQAGHVFTTRADTIGRHLLRGRPRALATHAAASTRGWPPSSSNASSAARPRPKWPRAGRHAHRRTSRTRSRAPRSRSGSATTCS